MNIGDKVWICVPLGTTLKPICMGIIVASHSGYYDVDRMGLHGGKQWITQERFLIPYKEPLPNLSGE